MFENLQITVCISLVKRVTCAVIYRPPHTHMFKFLFEFGDYCSTVTQVKKSDEFCFSRDFDINLMSNSNNVKLFV